VLERRRGTGVAADSGRWVTVNYTGWLTDGTVIDDTRKEAKPRNVLLGYGRVIPGWEEGLRGMRAGGRRILVVPPALGYGKAGKPGTVPSRATLVFDVEMKRVH
jgi:FKBP-type peptidyl-prolyl cis-trans isomerase